MSALQVTILLFASSLLTGLLTPYFRRVALRKMILDLPDQNHKTHQQAIPYLGGLAIIVGVTLSASTYVICFSPNDLGTILSILLPAILLGFVGLLDDILNLSPWIRFVAQSITGIAISTFLVLTSTLGIPTNSTILNYLATCFFVVTLCNSINFFDNVDGGASGAVAISATFVFFQSLVSQQWLIGALSIMLAGSALGFLWWNRSPARIYMGDAGSLFLGVVLASILVRLEPVKTAPPLSYFLVLLMVATPLLDTSVVISSRLRRGSSPFVGGRDHLSHRLIFNNWPKRSAVFLLWSLQLIFCVFSLLLNYVDRSYQTLVVGLALICWVGCYFYFLNLKFQNVTTEV